MVINKESRRRRRRKPKRNLQKLNPPSLLPYATRRVPLDLPGDDPHHDGPHVLDPVPPSSPSTPRSVGVRVFQRADPTPPPPCCQSQTNKEKKSKKIKIKKQKIKKNSPVFRAVPAHLARDVGSVAVGRSEQDPRRQTQVVCEAPGIARVRLVQPQSGERQVVGRDAEGASCLRGRGARGVCVSRHVAVDGC